MTGNADVIFTGCGVTNAAAQSQPGGRRRQAVVNGKRVRTIDVHAHCLIAEALALSGVKLREESRPGMLGMIPERLRAMDEQGIDMEAISINPYWYGMDRDLASQIVIGTDHPIPWQAGAVDHILDAPGFSDDERMAMLGGTAAKLLGIKQ